MKLLIFGASGPLGRAITQAALAAGHQVTGFVRSPGRLGSHARLREMAGDVLDASSVAAAVPGHDAVISALGHSRPSPAGPDLHPGTAHIIAAMQAAQVSRLIWISSHGVGDARGHSGFLFERIFVPWRLRAEFADKERQEALVIASAGHHPRLHQPRRRRPVRARRTKRRHPPAHRPDHRRNLTTSRATAGTKIATPFACMTTSPARRGRTPIRQSQPSIA